MLRTGVLIKYTPLASLFVFFLHFLKIKLKKRTREENRQGKTDSLFPGASPKHARSSPCRYSKTRGAIGVLFLPAERGPVAAKLRFIMAKCAMNLTITARVAITTPA